jgi:hypothetical protein
MAVAPRRLSLEELLELAPVIPDFDLTVEQLFTALAG